MFGLTKTSVSEKKQKMFKQTGVQILSLRFLMNKESKG
jgi:hypothetical protein